MVLVLGHPLCGGSELHAIHGHMQGDCSQHLGRVMSGEVTATGMLRIARPFSAFARMAR